VKAAVAPDRPFGVGLRLSAVAAEALAVPAELASLRAFLADRGLYVFTINGFPYGPFHGRPVKARVYEPDWRDPARLAYHDRLATLLAALLPPGQDGSVSTLPGGFYTRGTTVDEREAMAAQLLHHVATLVAIEATTGKTIRLALEPEPWCVMEGVGDTIDFFASRLLSTAAAARLATLTGRSAGESATALRRHLGVCFDACHMAVAFEEPAAALAAFRAAGIAIPKVQVSAGMVATLGDAEDAATRAALAGFADDVYLHQVVAHGAGGDRRRFLDLPDALRTPADDVPREWRIHFHVPLFRAALGALRSTQSWVTALLAVLRAEAYAGHLEVETYTWDVLPAAYRGEPVARAVAREIAWVRERLEA
jgi:sugar phosphate isomerase/epimerase